MSLAVKGARRLFLSLFSPLEIDFAELVKENDSSGLKVEEQPANRKMFAQQRLRRNRASPPDEDSYQVVWGALTCAFHTAERNSGKDLQA
jgi:hypothetical protein